MITPAARMTFLKLFHRFMMFTGFVYLINIVRNCAMTGTGLGICFFQDSVRFLWVRLLFRKAFDIDMCLTLWMVA